MRIKSLEITGFKSFADTVRLGFGDGITAVVGPNGCGKSNVVDALRWCMGEMSAKHLRGRAMQDVIFAGCEQRGPLGMAEVSLTLRNSGDGRMPPEYGAYPEITVTRRMYRDGLSEYLINKTPVRHKDVTDLFLGTGLGSHAYSIIEQGRIGFIVSSKPQERREFIEELAGITKYKSRKKAAERRIEATQQNLLRVGDLISELDRQVAQLRRQARKAERYKALRQELVELDLHAAAMEWLALCATGKQHAATSESLSESLTAARLEVDQRELTVEAEKVYLLEEERAAQAAQLACAEEETRVLALDKDLSAWRQRLVDIERRTQVAETEVTRAGVRALAIEAERQGLEQRFAELTRVIAERTQIGATTEAQVKVAQEQARQALAVVQVARTDLMTAMHELASARARAQTLERERSLWTERIERERHEHERTGTGLALADERRVSVLARDAELQAKTAHEKEELLLGVQSRDALRQETARLEGDLGGSRQELAEQRSRLSALEQMTFETAGAAPMPEAVQAALSLMSGMSGMSGLLVEHTVVQKEHEQALEALLGAIWQYHLIEDFASAKICVDALASAEAQRRGFVVGAHTQGDLSFPELSAEPGVIAAAASLVTTDETRRRPLLRLLAGFWVVADAQVAQDLAQRGLGRGFVTPSGTVFHSDGCVVFGKDSGVGVLTRAREIRELSDTIREKESTFATLSARQEECRNELHQAQEQVDGKEKSLRGLEIESVSLSKDEQALTRDEDRLKDEHRVAERRLSELATQSERIQTAITEAQGQLAHTATRLSQREERVAEAQAHQESGVQALRALETSLSEIRVTLASLRSERTGLEGHVQRLVAAHQELVQRIESEQRFCAASGAEHAQLILQIDSAEHTLVADTKSANDTRKKLLSARERYETRRQALSELEKATRTVRTTHDAQAAELSRLRLLFQENQLQRQHLEAQIRDRHDLELALVIGDYHLRALPDARHAERREALDRQLRGMGPLNLMAIEECALAEKRLTFLSTQRDDLVAALQQLEQAIRQMNRLCRQRFKDAFDAVNSTFQKVFPTLFRGGRAELVLVESEDVLDAGVEIVAEPPGKKLQSIALLSGGEKALTATALVFSMFLVKPTPFCVLDEVDAPLDDANVQRFNELLKEIAKQSQFIVITHSKETMTHADKLYGITMEEPGLSKVVPVELKTLAAQERAA